MKKIVLPILLLIGLLSNSYSQAPNWLWVQHSGGGSYQYPNGISVNDSQQLYIAGRYSGTSAFGSGPSISGGNDNPFVSKLDPNGNGIWNKNINYGFYDYPWGFWVDKNQNVYSSGVVSSGSNMFVEKYDRNGNLKWSLTNSGGGVASQAMAVDGAGCVYIAGSFNGTVTLGATTLTSSGQYMFVAKLDSNGNYMWARGVGGGGGYDCARGMTIDANANIYITGGYGGSPMFGSIAAPAATGYSNLYIAEYDSTGNAINLITATSAGIDNGDCCTLKGITIDSCNNLYVCGYYEGTAGFGAFNLTSLGSKDIYVAKCDNTGKWLWATNIGSTGDDYASSITLDKNDDIYVGGLYNNGSAKFGTTTITGGYYFDAKFTNDAGSFLWAQSAGSASNGGGIGGITVDKYGFSYVIGDGGNAAATQFGPFSYNASSNAEIFVAKLDTFHPLTITPNITTAYCPGVPGTLNYTVSGTFSAGNVFTAVLSDGSGSFTSADTIGSVIATGTGTINITIPNGTPTASGYLIKITASGMQPTTVVAGCKPHILTNINVVQAAVNINQPGALVATPADTTLCSGLSVTFHVSGATGVVWSPGATLNDSTSINPVATPVSTTTYTVSGGACTTPAQVVVTVGNGATGGSISAIRDTLCAGTPGNLVLMGNSSNIIEWQSSSVNTGSYTNIGTPNSSDTTKYKTEPLLQTTWYRATVGTGVCSAVSDSIELFVPPALTASFTSTNVGTKVSFNSSGSIGNIRTYFWDFGDGITSNDSNPTHTYARDTIYNPCLTIYDGSNCSYTFCRSIALGIPTISADGSWLIYPNPFSNELSIDTKTFNSRVQSIVMYDVLGRVMLNSVTGNAANSSYNLNTSLLANGMYYLVIKTTGINYVQKVVKQ